MAIRVRLPWKRRQSCEDRPFTGSMLFPELVWVHRELQRRTRPHDFAPRVARRRMLWRAARLNGRPSRSRSNRTGSIAAAELSSAELERRYQALAAAFQCSEGAIVSAYWCSTEASAVVLTERKRFARLLVDLRLHRETEWVTAEEPVVPELLHDGDTLAIRINRVLTPTPKRIAMGAVFSEQEYLLGFVERMGGHASRRQINSTVARHKEEVDRIERYYDRAARKAGRIFYFIGMLLGLSVVAGLAVGVAGVIGLFADLDLGAASTRQFYACFGAGALGAVVSVMTRMGKERGLTLDYEVGRSLIVLLGGFRPVLGAIFGVLAYFALASDFLPITPPSPDTAFFYYALIAFAAGFSERFAHVILGSADLAVSKGLTGTGTQPSESDVDDASMSKPPVAVADTGDRRLVQPAASPTLKKKV